MLFRIDYDHFLLHMIDHFTYDELVNMYYVMITSKLNNVGREPGRVTKCSAVYPPYGILNEWLETNNDEVFKRGYLKYLNSFDSNPIDHYIDTGEETSDMDTFLMKYIIAPFKAHQNVVFICAKEENLILDILFEFVKEHTSVEVIDLNKLFTDGEIGPIYIDRKLVHDKGVEIGKGAKRDGIKSLMRSKGGRDKLANELPDDRKIEELKKLGYTLTKYDITDSDSLSAMLMEAWDDEYGVY